MHGSGHRRRLREADHVLVLLAAGDRETAATALDAIAVGLSVSVFAEPEETTDSIDDELAAALAGELGVVDMGNEDD